MASRCSRPGGTGEASGPLPGRLRRSPCRGGSVGGTPVGGGALVRAAANGCCAGDPSSSLNRANAGRALAATGHQGLRGSSGCSLRSGQATGGTAPSGSTEFPRRAGGCRSLRPACSGAWSWWSRGRGRERGGSARVGSGGQPGGAASEARRVRPALLPASRAALSAGGGGERLVLRHARRRDRLFETARLKRGSFAGPGRAGMRRSGGAAAADLRRLLPGAGPVWPRMSSTPDAASAPRPVALGWSPHPLEAAKRPVGGTNRSRSP